MAKYLGTTSQVVLALLEDLGVEDKTHSSSVEYQWAVDISRTLSKKPPEPWEDKPKTEKKKKKKAEPETVAAEEEKVQKPEVIVHRRTEEAEVEAAPEETPAIAAEQKEPAAAETVEEAPATPEEIAAQMAAETPAAEAEAPETPAVQEEPAPQKAAPEQPRKAAEKKEAEISSEEAEKRRQQRELLARRFQALKKGPSGGKKKDTKPAVGKAATSTPPVGRRPRQKGRGAASWKREKRERYEAELEQEQLAAEKERSTVRVNETTTVGDIAATLNVPVGSVIGKLMGLGVMATINQRLDSDTMQILADEMGFELEEHSVQEGLLTDFGYEEEEDETKLQFRPPVVTVMGHVDHGKTKLLDAVRKTDVVAQEAGGITQHISAFSVKMEQGGTVSFLDTPGHEAFTAMRYRGAQVTDIVVLVVAADDGVMPQTIEAINHAKAAEVPIIVAINKVDKVGANIDRVKQQLAEQGLVATDWGGKTEMIPISALKGEGITDLLDTLILQAEIMELKANPDRPAQGTVIEAERDPHRGPVATVLIEQGTLRAGDALVAGPWSGKIRAMFNDRGEQVEEAGPSMPVEILGLSGVPSSGDPLHVVPDERRAKQYGIKLQQAQREREMQRRHHVTLSNLFSAIAEGALKELNLVVKADVQGSAEALVESLEGIESDKVRVRVIHSGVGAVSESDVQLAAASDAIVIGFHVRVSPAARELAGREAVEIETYEIIYEAIESIRGAMEGLLEKKLEERVIGSAEVREVFRSSKAGTIIGSQVTDGTIKRSAQIRLIRNDQIIHTGKLSSLRRFKDDVKEVNAGLECGIGIENYQDVKPGDIIEAFEMVEVAQTL